MEFLILKNSAVFILDWSITKYMHTVNSVLDYWFLPAGHDGKVIGEEHIENVIVFKFFFHTCVSGMFMFYNFLYTLKKWKYERTATGVDEGYITKAENVWIELIQESENYCGLSWMKNEKRQASQNIQQEFTTV